METESLTSTESFELVADPPQRVREEDVRVREAEEEAELFAELAALDDRGVRMDSFIKVAC